MLRQQSHAALGSAALAKLDPFRTVGARLLADFVDLALHTRKSTKLAFGQERGHVQGPFLLVLEGTARVTGPGSRPSRARRTGGTARASVERHVAAGDVLHGGHARARRRAKTRRRAGVALALEATHPDGVHYIVPDEELIERAVRASVPLARGFAAMLGVPPPKTHRIWMWSAADLSLPLEALTEWLAASVAAAFNERVAIVVLDGGAVSLRRWTGAAFVDVPFTPPDRLDDDDLAGALAAVDPGEGIRHLFFVHPSDPDVVPPAFAHLRFHRIVYVAPEPPAAAPAHLVSLIVPEAIFGCEPYFSSFVPTVLVPAGPDHMPPSSLTALAGVLWHQLGSLFGIGGRFASEEFVEEGGANGGTPASDFRLRRDLCRLRVDVGALDVLATSSHAAAFAAAGSEDPLRTSGARWARAVTNRRVGIALSGGGASCFRLVPVLEQLAAKHVPIDVVAGLSGGSLLGAYYARYGEEGLARYESRAAWYQALVTIAIVTSAPLQWAVDWDLGEARLEELEVRFVPLTTALPRHGPPRASAVVEGTLGEAVRASGAAPAIFARTRKNGMIYSDGVSASPLPARALQHYGADVVFAFNAVPGPDRRNPFDGHLLGRLAYDYTIVGRAIDGLVAGAFLLERISREAGEAAHVFIETSPTRASLFETVQFTSAPDLIRAAKRDARVRSGLKRCVDEWREFIGAV